MVGDEAIHNLARSRQGTQRPGLVLAHQARVSGHRSKYGCETAFDPLFLLGLHPIYLRSGQWCFGRGWGSRVAVGWVRLSIGHD
jgi:hypothetical protein